jgi:hypothetical protein
MTLLTRSLLLVLTGLLLMGSAPERGAGAVVLQLPGIDRSWNPRNGPSRTGGSTRRGSGSKPGGPTGMRGATGCRSSRRSGSAPASRWMPKRRSSSIGASWWNSPGGHGPIRPCCAWPREPRPGASSGRRSGTSRSWSGITRRVRSGWRRGPSWPASTHRWPGRGHPARPRGRRQARRQGGNGGIGSDGRRADDGGDPARLASFLLTFPRGSSQRRGRRGLDGSFTLQFGAFGEPAGARPSPRNSGWRGWMRGSSRWRGARSTGCAWRRSRPGRRPSPGPGPPGTGLRGDRESGPGPGAAGSLTRSWRRMRPEGTGASVHPGSTAGGPVARGRIRGSPARAPSGRGPPSRVRPGPGCRPRRAGPGGPAPPPPRSLPTLPRRRSRCRAGGVRPVPRR